MKRSKIFFLLLLIILTLFIKAQAISDVPQPALNVPPMVEERSVSTYVPSKAAPEQGVAVNILYPEKPRFDKGAPVVVVIPSEETSTGVDFSIHAVQSGFVEIRFAYPETGKRGFASGGIYDYGGPNCQCALKDVIEFASGKTVDAKGKKIAQLLPVKIYNPYIGLVGWSSGGNVLITTLTKYKSVIPYIAYLVFYESPVGPLFYPPCLGGAYDYISNRHYRSGSAATGKCLVDFRKLCFDAVTVRNYQFNKKIRQPNLPGVLFFDDNGNKEWDESSEYALPYLTDVGLEKQIYSPPVTKAITRLKIFGDNWPASVADLKESEAYFEPRDGSLYIADLCKLMPNVYVTIFGSVVDHLQRQEDHGHVCSLYNDWLQGKIAFLRLNPEPNYIGQIGNMNRSNFSDNRPFASVDTSDINEFLEPEGLLPDYVYIEASISELADRKYFNNLNADLPKPIVVYDNEANKGK